MDAIFNHGKKYNVYHFIIIDDLNSFLSEEDKIDRSEGKLNNWATISEIREKAEFYGYTWAISWSCNAIALVPNEFCFMCDGIYNDDKEQVIRYLKEKENK